MKALKIMLFAIMIVGTMQSCIRVEIEEDCYYEPVFLGYDQYDRAIYEEKLVCYSY